MSHTVIKFTWWTTQWLILPIQIHQRCLPLSRQQLKAFTSLSKEPCFTNAHLQVHFVHVACVQYILIGHWVHSTASHDKFRAWPIRPCSPQMFKKQTAGYTTIHINYLPNKSFVQFPHHPPSTSILLDCLWGLYQILEPVPTWADQVFVLTGKGRFCMENSAPADAITSESFSVVTDPRDWSLLMPLCASPKMEAHTQVMMGETQ